MYALRCFILAQTVSAGVTDDESSVLQFTNVESMGDVGLASTKTDAKWGTSTSSHRLINYGFVFTGELDIAPKGRLFDIDDESDEDVQSLWQPGWTGSVQTSTTKQEMSKNMSLSFGVSANILGAFSFGLDTKFSTSSTSSSRTMSAVMEDRYYKYSVNLNAAPASKRLRAPVRDAFNSYSAERIIQSFGEFYASSIKLGGVLRSVIEQQQVSEEESQNFSLQVTGAYQGLFVQAAMSGGFSVGSSLTQSSESTSTSAKALGGSTTLWLGPEDFKTKQKAWAKTLTDDNLAVVNANLHPIWELITDVNPTKAAEVRQILTARWMKSDKHLQYLDSLPLEVSKQWSLIGWKSYCDNDLELSGVKGNWTGAVRGPDRCMAAASKNLRCGTTIELDSNSCKCIKHGDDCEATRVNDASKALYTETERCHTEMFSSDRYCGNRIDIGNMSRAKCIQALIQDSRCGREYVQFDRNTNACKCIPHEGCQWKDSGDGWADVYRLRCDAPSLAR